MTLIKFIAKEMGCSYHTARARLKRDDVRALELQIQWLELQKQKKQQINNLKQQIKEQK